MRIILHYYVYYWFWQCKVNIYAIYNVHTINALLQVSNVQILISSWYCEYFCKLKCTVSTLSQQPIQQSLIRV